MSLDYESREAFAARARAARAAAPSSRVMRWMGSAAYGVLATFGWLVTAAAFFDDDGDPPWIVASIGLIIAIPCTIRFAAVMRIGRRQLDERGLS